MLCYSTSGTGVLLLLPANQIVVCHESHSLHLMLSLSFGFPRFLQLGFSLAIFSRFFSLNVLSYLSRLLLHETNVMWFGGYVTEKINCPRSRRKPSLLNSFENDLG